tara:strand:- start:551 stop:772 length:222 start_codon:yes stop_codon:yes gene_type:complete
MSKPQQDPINPIYYTKGIEVTKFAQSHGLSFAEGNVVKYVVRHKHKNGLEDLKKARKYIDLLIENEENKKSTK